MVGGGSCFTLVGAVDVGQYGCTLRGCTTGSTLGAGVASWLIGVDNVVGVGTVGNMGGNGNIGRRG